MKLIVYFWGSNSDDILRKTLAGLGHEVVVYDRICEHYTRDIKFAQGLINLIHECCAEAVVSNDYYPVISMVCNTTGIPYYSWVYDSPHYTLYAVTSGYKCNHIGCFDRALVQRLNELGIRTVKHLPLGADWSGYEGCRSSTGECGKYVCDVSFVGSLYTGKHNYYDALKDDLLLRDRADMITERQCFDYEHDHIAGFWDKDIAGSDEIRKHVVELLMREELLPGKDYIEDIEYIFNAHFLERKVTVEERRRLLTEVARREYDFALYTDSDLKDCSVLTKACRGRVDYSTEMPLVFMNSRINLNITLRSIHTGIPLRALDIMGCGGFLLSNYQQELAEYFAEDKEVVLFYDMEDCLEKIDFYLAHEEKRKEIAAAGRIAVMERFGYRRQLERLLGL